MFRIAHISDLHIPPLPRISPGQMIGKRLLGLFSWHYKWKREHRQPVLDALLAHLEEQQPDHICVTGDITYTTLPAEVDAAADWLARLGEPGKVSLIPGNHDAYVPGALDYVNERWAPWMKDDDGGAGFPYLHRRGPVNIIGLSSAVATPPTVSLGRIGPAQLENTRVLLERIRQEQRPTLLLVHHPPHNGAAWRLRALSDRKDLQQLLAQLPVDLILHGHLHYPIRAAIETPSGSIPILGAASASATGSRKSVAHYHVIEIEDGGNRPRMTVQHYFYDPDAGRFNLSDTQTL